jgi:hypothetical protein
MHPISRQLAVTMASGDGMPRVIADRSTLYLVTPQGDVWRVFDSNEPGGEPRHAPVDDPAVSVRIFIGSGPNGIVRLHRFSAGESRAIGPADLNRQLIISTTAGK